MQQRDLVDAKLLIAQGLLQRGQFHGKSGVRVALFYRDGGPDLISIHLRTQLHGTEPVGVHRDAHFAVPRGFN
jgi:hypothetical protein